jgi:ribosome-associated protein
MLVQSERYRDQERNRTDCLEKLRAMLLQATMKPRPRKPTRPSRGAKEARLRAKKRRSSTKTARRRPIEE